MKFVSMFNIFMIELIEKVNNIVFSKDRYLFNVGLCLYLLFLCIVILFLNLVMYI